AGTWRAGAGGGGKEPGAAEERRRAAAAAQDEDRPGRPAGRCDPRTARQLFVAAVRAAGVGAGGPAPGDAGGRDQPRAVRRDLYRWRSGAAFGTAHARWKARSARALLQHPAEATGAFR